MQAAFSFFLLQRCLSRTFCAWKNEYLTYFSRQDELVLNRHYDQFSRTRNQL
jgi:hypothetical protein